MTDPVSPPSSTRLANPNLSLILHWLTEFLILGALWYAAMHNLIPTWMAVLASTVIGGWVPASMVLQVLGVIGRAQLGVSGQTASQVAAALADQNASPPPAPTAPPTPPASTPIVPPPVTAFLVAFAVHALHRGH